MAQKAGQLRLLTGLLCPPIIGLGDADEDGGRTDIRVTTVRSQWGALVSTFERVAVAAWRAITSSHVSIALLAALLIVTLLGGLLPQTAPGVQPGSPRYQEWRGQVRSPWGTVADALEALGLLGVFQSRPFYLLMAIVAVVAVLRLASLWIPPWVPAPPRRASTRDFTLSRDKAGAWEEITLALRGMGLGVVRQISHGGAEHAAARRVGVARSMPGLLYLGVLALLLASAIEWRFGWAGPRLELALGETRPLGGETGLAARLEQIDLLPLADGTLQRFDSHVSLIRGATVEKTVTLGLDRRAAYHGLSLYQLGFGPAVRVSAQKASGQPLRMQRTVGDTSVQRILRLRFSGRQQEQLVTIPEADLVVRLVYYPALPIRGFSTRALHIQLLRGSTGQVQAEQFLAENGQVMSDDVRVDIAFEYSVTLRPEREPGLPLAAFGGALIMLGLVGYLIWPTREAWLIVRQENQSCTCQIIVSRGNAGASWFIALVSNLSGGANG